ncbi:MAG: Ppx/GppA family phosphatase [Syntrophomonadaceae bacterium]|nr:Ppx/GppA family phosphatase [Syntrophomonadaceae bacterium]
MKTIGIIDLGSNSIRLVLVQLGEKGNFKIVEDYKESVRLEEGMGEKGGMEQDRMEHALEALTTFKDICDGVGAEEIIATGTEALRRAANGDELLERARRECGIDIRVLSGQEEAWYGFFGVAHSMKPEHALLMDIGGGSTELTLVENGELKASTSLHVGTINLNSRFGLQGRLGPQQTSALEEYLAKSFAGVPWLRNINCPMIIGIGGSSRTLAKIDRKRKDYPLDLQHNYEMSVEDVTAIYHQMLPLSLEQRRKIKGLSRDRADLLTGAVASMAVLMDYCHIPTMRVSANGLREGIIYEYLNKQGIRPDDPLDFSLQSQIYNFDLNEKHSRQVSELALSMFGQMHSLHGLHEPMARVLKTAAMMHASGLALRYYNYPLHSFYITLNSAINGLTQRELLMAAYVSTIHAKHDYKIDVDKYKALINREDVESIQKLALILRLAENLDRTMCSRVDRVDVSILGDDVVIKTTANGRISMELRDANRSANLFKKVFKKKLLVV